MSHETQEETKETSREESSQVNFGTAIEYMKNGHPITRKGWNGKGMYLELQTPDENSKMSLPYIYMCIPVQGKYKEEPIVDRVPWIASQTDILSTDWIVV